MSSTPSQHAIKSVYAGMVPLAIAAEDYPQVRKDLAAQATIWEVWGSASPQVIASARSEIARLDIALNYPLGER